MDSCSAMKFMNYYKKYGSEEDIKMAEQYSESCESTCFSLYINCEGKFYPCSFIEGESFEGLDCTIEGLDFISDIWLNKDVQNIRNKILDAKTCGRSCYNFEI